MVPVDAQSGVFIDLADLMPEERFVICEQVVTELERTSNKNTAHLFAKQGRSDCFHQGADYKIVKRILRRFAFVDVNERREVCAPYVLAQAQELMESGRSVALITEDYRRKMPPLISLAAAADDLAIPRLGMMEVLGTLGIWPRG